MQGQIDAASIKAVDAHKKHFPPDKKLEGLELKNVVEEGLTEFRRLLNNDKDVAWARKSDPYDVAMPYKHNTVVKGVDDAIYRFSDTKLRENKELIAVDRLHILINDKLHGEEEITLIKESVDNPNSIEYRAVFLGDDNKSPVSLNDFKPESRRGKFSRVASFFGFGRQKTQNNLQVIDRDYGLIDSGYAANGMYKMLDRMKKDFGEKEKID